VKHPVLFALRKLSLGIILIAVASGVLLYSDLDRRKSSATESNDSAESTRKPNSKKVFKVAILQHASQRILEEGVEGYIQGLAAGGFEDGYRMKLQRFNSEGDLATANTIAKQLTDGSYDLVITGSTVSLQCVANANRMGFVQHVFAMVTDPFSAGVGLSREHPEQHPRHLVGIGTMQPVQRSFQLARQFNPNLKSVGVVWNSSEANSEAQMIIARAVCDKMNITLEEATIDNSSGVQQAAASLESRGVEALWGLGDVSVLVAMDALIGEGKKGGIPTFTVIPPSTEKGALFDIGANYIEVGRKAGDIAASIMNGADPSKIVIENYVPEKLMINKNALKGLNGSWNIPENILATADVVIDENGEHTKTAH